MFKSKLEKFIAKRMVLYIVLSAAADIVFLGSHRWPVFAGLIAGALIGLGRLRCNEWIFRRMLKPGGAKTAAGGTVAFTISQLVLILVIVLAYFLDIWALYGLIAGVSAAPIIIMINSITEAFGITKNNFE